MKKIQFEATSEGNALIATDGTIKAVCPVPDGASDDYGYLTMKKAILEKLESMGSSEDISFWYDGQEQYLAEDASADCEVFVDVCID